MKPINRQLKPLVLDALKYFPAVYINGPRQSGKTTLVCDLLADDFRAKVITFDNLLERSAAQRNPLSYIRESGKPLIIDEVQFAQEIFRPLKILIDEQRQEALHNDTNPNGLYLLTGSANLAVIPELANAMVGRMATLTLLPLSAAEVMNQTPSFIERCFSKDFSDITIRNIQLTEIIRKATYPELARHSQAMIGHWFNSYIQKITLNDSRSIYNLEKIELMPILLQSLATRAGSLVNDASIGREIGLNAVTTRNYRTLLSGLFITNALRPWCRKITKRLVKAKKLYFHDTMLLCHLLESTPADLSRNNPMRFGHVLENFVFSELCKQNNATGERATISFYRTSDGREVDFILERQNKLVALEVKNTENITDQDFAGIKELQANTGGDFHCGIILCNSPRVIAYEKDIYLIPFSALWQ
ncbi:MAG: ATP-binding protein [Aestuariivita sp.]|nr:ATP-binding protein [Aestuariivita sp.]MCY4202729.1 ATP-binding protein [Aestuariivita sp.]